MLKDGKVVSHMAKATRGVIARSLLVGNVDPQTPEELTKVLDGLGHTVALGPAPAGRRPWTVDVMV